MSHWFYWDPDPISFVIPGINRPIAWYGILFALGFFIGFYLLRALFKKSLSHSGSIARENVLLVYLARFIKSSIFRFASLR